MNNGNPVTTQASGRRPTMIKGLVPSLPERGKIKIGVKGAMMTSRRGREFQPPQKLDHFVVTTLERGRDGNFLPDAALMERLGEKPTEIPVRLLYDDPVLNFPTRLACFVGRTLWCAGDGEVATRMTELPSEVEGDRVQLKPHEVQCPCFRQDPAYMGRDKCKMNGSLSVLIEGARGLGGVWKFRTTSFNTINGIMSSMALLRNMTGGILANIPLKLEVQAKQATSPTDGAQLTIYVVNLVYDGEPDELLEIAHTIALRRAKAHVSIEHIEEEARRSLQLLPPSNAPLPGDEVTDVLEEFYPEQVQVGEPESAVGEGDQGLRAEEDLEPEYAVLDNDGQTFQFGRERAIKALHAIFTDARGYNDLDRMSAAWENNLVTIEKLTREGAGTEAAALTAYYGECRDLIPRKPAPPPHTPSDPPATDDGPAHAPPLGVGAPAPVDPNHVTPPPAPTAQSDIFPGDLPTGERLVPRGVPTQPAPQPAAAPANDRPAEHYLAPPMKNGKPDWRVWALVKFTPQLKQKTDSDDLAYFLADNDAGLTAAKGVLSPTERRELEAAITAQWQVVDTAGPQA